MDYTQILRENGMKKYLPGDATTKEGQAKMLSTVADTIDVIVPFNMNAEISIWNKDINNEEDFKKLVGSVAYKVNELIGMANEQPLKDKLVNTDNLRLIQTWIVLDFYCYILKPEFTVNILNVRKIITEILYGRRFLIDEFGTEFNNVSDKTATFNMLDAEIQKLRKRKKTFGIIIIVAVCVMALMMLLSNLTESMNKEVPYSNFDKNGPENEYVAVELDFIAPVSESYYYNEATGDKDYSRTEYYCLYGLSTTQEHGIIKLEHDELYGDELKQILEYSKGEDATVPPKSIRIYGDTEKMPSYVYQHFIEEVGVGSGYNLGEVCIDGQLSPVKDISAISMLCIMIGGGSVYVLIGFLIAYFVTKSKIKKKEQLSKIL